MRSATSHGPISPKLLKHFAAAAAVLTGLLALFASGEDWGARAQLDAAEAKNQLVATEAEKLGTKKLAAKLKVNNDIPAGSFGNDAGSNVGFAGGDYSDYRPARASIRPPQARLPLPQLQQNPHGAEPQTAPAGQDRPDGDPGGNGAGPEPFQPSAEQIEQARQASAQRSGGGSSAD